MVINMIVAKVTGSVVSTNKSDRMTGMKMLIVDEIDILKQKQTGKLKVAIDTVGAGKGEIVMCVSGSSSRQTMQTDGKPVDLAIVGIIDSLELLGKTIYRKFESERRASEKPAVKQTPAQKGKPGAAASDTAKPKKQ